MTRFQLVPVTHAEANRFVIALHRHNGPLPASILRVGAADTDGRVVGVAIAGLPKARMSARLGTLEVNRICTDGTRNACSFLYGAIARATKALGYRRLITYTLAAEDGASLKASGWVLVGETKAEAWTRSAATRGHHVNRNHDEGAKNRWEIRFALDPPPLIWPEEARSDQRSLFADGVDGNAPGDQLGSAGSTPALRSPFFHPSEEKP